MKAQYLREIEGWVEKAKPPGSVIMAILMNDLRTAVLLIPEEELPDLREIVSFLQTWAPSRCFGSLDRIAEWKTDENCERIRQTIDRIGSWHNRPREEE